jgi:hypothetical protein
MVPQQKKIPEYLIKRDVPEGAYVSDHVIALAQVYLDMKEAFPVLNSVEYENDWPLNNMVEYKLSEQRKKLRKQEREAEGGLDKGGKKGKKSKAQKGGKENDQSEEEDDSSDSSPEPSKRKSPQPEPDDKVPGATIKSSEKAEPQPDDKAPGDTVEEEEEEEDGAGQDLAEGGEQGDDNSANGEGEDEREGELEDPDFLLLGPYLLSHLWRTFLTLLSTSR